MEVNKAGLFHLFMTSYDLLFGGSWSIYYLTKYQQAVPSTEPPKNKVGCFFLAV